MDDRQLHRRSLLTLSVIVGLVAGFLFHDGRRGQLQNLPNGPFGPGQPDDQFGGPEPDDAHFTGVIIRLNADGTTPTDNPFYAAGAAFPGEVGENIRKIFSYGHRNSFGMAIDFSPRGAGSVWLQENGDDSFSELNRVTPGNTMSGRQGSNRRGEFASLCPFFSSVATAGISEISK